MRAIVGWLASSLGYLVYTGAVLILLLWFLMPKDTFRSWLEYRLNTALPAVQWEINSLEQSFWPFGLTASGIRATMKSGERGTLLHVDECRLSPDVPGLLRGGGRVPARYEAKTLGGRLSGKVSLDVDGRQLAVDGTGEGLEVGLLETLWQVLGREVTGRMVTSYQGAFLWPDLTPGDMQGDLALADGSMELMQPVFGLGRLDFSELDAAVTLQNGVLTVDKGRLESRMLAGEYAGTVTLAAPLFLSEVALEGTMEPRSELLAGLQDQMMVTLIKNQLQDGRLSFRVSGSLMEPGILFQGASGVIDGIIRSGEAGQ